MQTEQGALTRPSAAGDFLLDPVMNLELARDRLRQFREFVKDYLVEDEDFGTIPGTPKPTLLKPGADKLCELYGLADDYEVEKVEDFDKGLFDYTVKCILTSRRGGFLVATGLGSCSSWEKKYRYREAGRKCPTCKAEAITKSKPEYGGGWFCFARKGGCGAKFAADDPAIMEQTGGRVQNEDTADVKNTVLKMAKKRAKIDATLSATRSSGLFTQDLEDIDRDGGDHDEDRGRRDDSRDERRDDRRQDDRGGKNRDSSGKSGSKEKDKPPADNAKKAQSTVEGKQDKPTDAQRSAFFGRAKELNWGMAAVRHLLQALFKHTDSSKLSLADIDKAIKTMEKGDPDEVLANL
jgi:hypothetical protein